MRRCISTRRKVYSTCRLSRIIKKSRNLSITAARNPFNHTKIYHRRCGVRIEHGYRVKRGREGFVPWRVGKTLRNRKHHVARYKITRNDLDWLLMVKTKSASYGWQRGRMAYVRKKRDSERLHPNHVENMLVAHWWKI